MKLNASELCVSASVHTGADICHIYIAIAGGSYLSRTIARQITNCVFLVLATKSKWLIFCNFIIYLRMAIAAHTAQILAATYSC